MQMTAYAVITYTMQDIIILPFERYIRKIKSSCPAYLYITVQTSCSMESREPAQSIHLREKNIAGPTERPTMRMHCQARRGGPAFFDEDDVCAGL